MTIGELWNQVMAVVDWSFFAQKIFEILVILVVFQILIRVSAKLIDRFIEVSQARMPEDAQINRAETLRGLLKSTLRYLLYFIAIMTILPLINIPTGQFLAGAGVLGVALGFGAQSLVRDVISGFFILFENQFVVGEFVEAADVSGIIEEIGLRTTRIKDFGGQLHYIPNGTIDRVTNFSRGAMRVLVNVDIAYEEDVDQAIDVLTELCEELQASMEEILEGPRVLGLSSLNDSSVSLMVWARAANMQQWAASREIRLQIKRRLNEAGIEIPYPRRVVVPARKTKIIDYEEEGAE